MIIGAGPVALFAVFELGLFDMKCHLIDILDRPGGQCAELYPEKPIYDIPGYPVITAQGSSTSSWSRSRLSIRIHLQPHGDRAGKARRRRLPRDDRRRGAFRGKVVVIAAGGGSFQPKRPPIPGIEAYEGSSVFYSVRRMEEFRGQDVVIVGGGDSALDWTINLQPIARRVTLVHRRPEFRAAPDSVNKMYALQETKQLDFVIGQVTGLSGERRPAIVGHDQGARTAKSTLPCTRLLPFFGLTMKLGPIARMGPQSPREPDPGRHRKVRDLRAGHLRHRRHQLVSRQAEAHPVWLPRGGADGPGREAHRQPGRADRLPVHDVIHQPAEEARRRLRFGPVSRRSRADCRYLPLASMRSSR